jgi:phenylacetic acid degradation operon negative regulatory protein
VLGEFVLPAGGRASTATVLDALGALGVEAKTTRQALARTATAGLLVSERVGRTAHWQLTARAEQLLSEGTERIYRFGLEQNDWDGRWLLVLATVPESNRHLRHRLRARLAWQGFASIATGVWASPWVDREGAARAALADSGLADAAFSFVGEAGSLGSIDARAFEVWDLATIEAQYAAFLAATEAKHPTSDSARFVELSGLVHDWRHFPGADPDLPRSLLPEGWNGWRAASIFHDRHDRWVRGAWRWWQGCGGAPKR